MPVYGYSRGPPINYIFPLSFYHICGIVDNPIPSLLDRHAKQQDFVLNTDGYNFPKARFKRVPLLLTPEHRLILLLSNELFK